MKTTIFIVALLGAVCAFPKEEKLRFKNLYVDPLEKSDDVISRIVNGHEASPHSIPYQAYLIITSSDGSRWLCGGSLISPSYVLTAGHCVEDSIRAEVYLGAHNLQAQESSRVVVVSNNLRLHASYNGRLIKNDIGLIGLPEPVHLNANINVIALPKRSETTNYEGANVRVSGWGLTSGSGSTSPVLLQVNSTVISNSLCDSYYGIVVDSEVCISGSGGVGSCNGDSGGPLVAGNEQIGIVSYGAAGCLAGYPSAFTRVSSYLDWIEQHTDLKF